MGVRTTAEIIGGTVLIAGGIAGGMAIANHLQKETQGGPVTINCNASDGMPGCVTSEGNSQTFVSKGKIITSSANSPVEKNEKLGEKNKKEVQENKDLTDLCSTYLSKVQEIYNPTSQSQRDSIDEFCKEPKKYKSKYSVKLSDCVAPEGFDSAKKESLQAFCSDTILSGSKKPSTYKWTKSSELPSEKVASSCKSYVDQLTKWIKPITQKQINLIYEFCSSPAGESKQKTESSIARNACLAAMKKHQPYLQSSSEFTIVNNFCTSVIEAGPANAGKFKLTVLQ